MEYELCVFPAPAGMNRDAVYKFFEHCSVPCARRDEPCYITVTDEDGECSLRPQG